MTIFHIDMLPAREGDCLWIEYGPVDNPYRILIDGGRKLAWASLKARMEALPIDQRTFELLILTHVDADHIEGLLELVGQENPPVHFKDVWFNAHHHLLPPVEEMGAKQGEAFSAGIQKHGWPWNKAFDGGAAAIAEDGALPRSTLGGGLEIILLSPDRTQLAALEPVWRRELEKAGLVPGSAPADTDDDGVESLGALRPNEVAEAARVPFTPDRSEANGSSICVLLQYEGRTALLSGDAHAARVVASLAKLGEEPLALDAIKLSHHGSRGTHSVELMAWIRPHRVLVSTDGSRHKHPHLEAIARTLMHAERPLQLVFNYRSTQSQQWNAAALKRDLNYETAYPAEDAAGFMRVEL